MNNLITKIIKDCAKETNKQLHNATPDAKHMNHYDTDELSTIFMHEINRLNKIKIPKYK